MSDNRNPKFKDLPLEAKGPIECALEVTHPCLPKKGTLLAEFVGQGRSLLNSSIFNKGSAFSKEERELFKLQGMLPSAVHTLEQQVERAYGQYKSREDPMAKNTFMASMKSQNEVLYYKLAETYIKEMFEVRSIWAFLYPSVP